MKNVKFLGFKFDFFLLNTSQTRDIRTKTQVKYGKNIFLLIFLQTKCLIVSQILGYRLVPARPRY